MNGVYVQYGCGLDAPYGWLNFDASPRLRLEKSLFGAVMRNKLFPAGALVGNIISGLPVRDGSAAGVYASHVLEHMRRADCRVALRNTHRMLAPGGIFRLIVPDLRVRAERYLATNGEDRDAAHAFMASLHVTTEDGRWPALRELIGNSRHLWMWDERTMTRALIDAGFSRIRRCQFGDCEDAMFRLVEDEGRFVDGDLIECALEARKV